MRPHHHDQGTQPPVHPSGKQHAARTFKPVSRSAQRGIGHVHLLAIAGIAIMAVSLLVAALNAPADGPWLFVALIVGVGCLGLSWQGGILHGEAPAARQLPADRPAEPPAGEHALAVQLQDARRELERVREVERELTQAKQEAEAGTMAKGEFLATMSHEIRTPLNGIIPLLDILLSTRLSDDQRDYLATAYQSAKQLLSIVDDILDYSKIEANKLDLESVGLNLKEVVDSVTRLLAKNAEAKGLRFSATIDPNVRLAMRGDPVRLRQVLTNLVSNAIKFTVRGTVTIELKKRGESRTHTELLFSVRDSGVGIAPEVQAKLFKPFIQADASTTRIHGGTGLGLVICRRIVELMGGQIGVKSELGRGSTFWFSVPLLKAVGDMTPARTDLHGARAMIVTTDQLMLRKISAQFSTWGVNYVQTSVSADALAKLRAAAAMGESWAYDFLVLDWGAMKNTALSLARNVMRDPPLARVRVVAISGDEGVPQEMRGTSRFAAFGRQFGEVDLRAGMQRLIEADAGQDVQSVDNLLPAGGDAAPAAPAAPANPALLPTSPVASAAVGGHVLLVEDNAVNRQVAQRLLSLVGVGFDIAENGRQGVEKLATERYDAVLMDCQMPIMDGYTATRTIRKLEVDGVRSGHIPIIAMTANAMAGDREKCLASGMDDYMSKPLNRALLEQTLRKWIAHALPAPAALARPPGVGARTTGSAAAVAAPSRASVAAPATRLAAATPAVPAVARARRGPAVQGAPQSDVAAINPEIIQDLLEMMGSEFTDLVKVYLEDTPKSLSILERAAGEASLEGLVAPAHSLKSTSANLGALGLSEMAKRIEHGSRMGKLPADPILLVAEAQAEFRRVADELRRIIAA
jgi:signal transduction histidine kinase/CheY-like chemotaxis protein/HPt (histidine-containing phosphotransfer) domain-containing protein